MDKCEWHGCEREATHAPKICVPAMGWALETHQPLSVIMGLKFCVEHAQRFDVRGTLAIDEPKSMRRVFEILAGDRCRPDYDRAWVDPIPIESEAFRALEGSRK